MFVEDVPADVTLIQHALRQGGLRIRSQRVDSNEAFVSALKQLRPDVILSDHGLPSFDGFTALAVAREKCPAVPFIFIAGAMEERMAREAVEKGAIDYVPKDNLPKLVRIIKRLVRVRGEPPADEAGLARVLELAFDAILHIDHEGRICEWNPAAARLFGYSREEELGRFVDDLIVTDSLRAAYQGGLANYLITGGGSLLNRPIEMSLRRADGTELAAEVAFTRSDSREESGCVAVIRDITQRTQAEADLREREEQYRLLVEGVRDYAIYRLDPEGRVTSWNAGAERLEGYRAEEILGQSYSVFFTAEDIERRLPAESLHRALLHGETRSEGWRVRKDGIRFWSQGIITALYDKQGRHYGFAKVAHDLTQRKLADETIARLHAELERRVTERTTQLESAVQELEAFSYSVSHDLRAPLRHVLSYIEIMESEVGPALNASGRRYLKTIAESAKQMGNLIDALLAFARIGRIEMRHQAVDMNALVKEAQRQFRDELKGREVFWQIGPLPEVHGDPVLLRQALINLLSNAIKYTRNQPRPKIEITAEERPDEFVFHVQDNGVGFDSAYADKLFGVFQRLHPTGEFEGIGIGLANVRRVIQRHGGRVWAQGAPGKGATFHFALPKSAE